MFGDGKYSLILNFYAKTGMKNAICRSKMSTNINLDIRLRYQYQPDMIYQISAMITDMIFDISNFFDISILILPTLANSSSPDGLIKSG